MSEIPKLVAKNEKQKEYIRAIKNHQLIIADGLAGTGKTSLACAMAVQALRKKETEKIIITRPLLECGQKFAFLPGSLNEKMYPYVDMIFQELKKWSTKEEFKKWESEDRIEIGAIELMRGRNFVDCYIIIDEIENATYQQIKMLLTRITESCKMIMIGDASQSDLNEEYPPIVGVYEQLKISNINELAIVEFGIDDIVRSDIVSKILKALRHY